MNIKRSAGLVAVGVLGLATAAQGQIAAEWIPSSFGFGGSIGLTNNGSIVNVQHGQEFTSLRSGTMQTIAMQLSRRAGVTQPLLIDFYDSNASHTPGTLLGTANLAAVNIPSGASAMVDFDVSGMGVDLVNGQQYIMMLRVVTPSTSNPYGVAGSSTESYDGGKRVQSTDGINFNATPNGDWAFRVIVPTPGTAAMGLWAGVFAMGRRRRA